MDSYNENLIKKLYNMDIITEMKSTKKYNELLHKYNELYKTIEDMELKEKFTKLEELKNELNAEYGKMIFKTGFSMATKIIIEALNTKI